MKLESELIRNCSGGIWNTCLAMPRRGFGGTLLRAWEMRPSTSSLNFEHLHFPPFLIVLPVVFIVTPHSPLPEQFKVTSLDLTLNAGSNRVPKRPSIGN